MTIQQFIFQALGVSLCLASCTQEPAGIMIAGKVEGLTSEYVVLCRSQDRVSYTEWTETLDTATVDSSGGFAFQVAVGEPDLYQVCDQRGYPVFTEMYLTPGDTISVVVSKTDGKRKTVVNGARAAAYTYYDLLDSARQADKAFGLSYRDLATLDIDTVQTLLYERLGKERTLLRTHFGGHPEWEPIARHAKAQRDFSVLGSFYDYLEYHNYYTNDTFLYLTPEPSYYQFLDSIDLSDVPEYYTWEYPSFLINYMEDKVHHDNGDLPDSIFWENKLSLMFEAAKKYLSGTTRDAALFALTGEFSHALSNENCFGQIGEMESYFVENHTSADLLKKFQYVVRQFEVLKPGNPVPDLALPGIDGDTIRLSDLRGKVLYVDFWGTWCYPCLQELPHSLKLHETFEGEDVAFVFIGLESSGEQLDDWKAFVQGERSFSYAPFLEQRVYPGVHLLAEGQFGNPALDPFKINYAPTYMLVDGAGRIVSPRASRPSDPETEGKIREALKTL